MAAPDAEKRIYLRHPRRMPCVFNVDGEQHRGFISNVSASGFFVQSSSRAEPPAQVIVTIDNEGETIVVSGHVARRHKSHRSVAAVDRPGLGIQIDSAPESYFRMVLALEEKEGAPG